MPEYPADLVFTSACILAKREITLMSKTLRESIIQQLVNNALIFRVLFLASIPVACTGQIPFLMMLTERLEFLCLDSVADHIYA